MPVAGIPLNTLVEVTTPASTAAALIPARYSAAPTWSASRGSCIDAGESIACHPGSNGEAMIRSNVIDPPEARTSRAATGIALSARCDPSRGTKICLNIVSLPSIFLLLFHFQLLENYFDAQEWEKHHHIQQVLHPQRRVYVYNITIISRRKEHISRLYHGEAPNYR
jgi:hypothetical protein